MSDNFTPIGNKVILKVTEAEKLSKGGIIIPDTVEDPPTVGVVVAANTEVMNKYLLRLGDEVLFGRHTAVKVKLNGANLHIIDIDKAYGIFHND